MGWQKSGKQALVNFGKFVLTCLLAALSSNSAKAETRMIGDVLRIHGDWRIADGASQLLIGEAVPAGALIKAASPHEGDHIVVVLLNGERLSAICSKETCAATLQLPNSYVKSEVSVDKLLAAVRYVLLNQRQAVVSAYGSTSSRSLAFQRFELVVQLDSQHPISLSSQMATLPEGDYYLELSRASDSSYVSGKNVHWMRDGPVTLSLPGAGSYVVLVKDKSENELLNVFIAAVDSSSYEAARQSYDLARAACAQWKDTDGVESAHYFLRAYLLSLTTR